MRYLFLLLITLSPNGVYSADHAATPDESSENNVNSAAPSPGEKVRALIQRTSKGELPPEGRALLWQELAEMKHWTPTVIETFLAAIKRDDADAFAAADNLIRHIPTDKVTSSVFEAFLHAAKSSKDPKVRSLAVKSLVRFPPVPLKFNNSKTLKRTLNWIVSNDSDEEVRSIAKTSLELIDLTRSMSADTLFGR